MRSTVRSFNYFAPSSLEETLKLLRSSRQVSIYAGGTDFIPACRMKGFEPKTVVALKNLQSRLSYINEAGGEVKIGAMTKMREIEKSPLIAKEAPSLRYAVSQVGSVQIRNKATLGGNLCNASPAADTVPPLLTLDATVKLAGHGKGRVVPLAGFFVGPGKTVIQKGELLQEVEFKKDKGHSSFRKIGRRLGEDISVASAAVHFDVKNSKLRNVRVALGSVAPTPIRAHRAEEAIEGQTPNEANFEKAAGIAMEECRPISDVRASEYYRRRVVRVLVKSCFEDAMAPAGRA